MIFTAVSLRAAGRSVNGRQLVLALLLVLLFGSWQTTVGQGADPQVRQRALEAFHGSDLEGKDGPLAKAGFDLTLLYYKWEAAQQQGTVADVAPSTSLPVRAGRVMIDATAAQNPAALRDSLMALGLTNGAQAGPVVSGELPIAAIPEAARLDNLRAMRPARAQTHGTGRPSVLDTTAVNRTPAGPVSTESAQRGWAWLGAATAVVAGWLLLFGFWH